MADQVNKALGGYGAESRQADDSPTQKSRASPAGKESQKAPGKKERRLKTSTITFNELIKLLIFLLLFAVVVYAMGKGMDPAPMLETLGKILGSFLGGHAALAPAVDFAAPGGPTLLFLSLLMGLLCATSGLLIRGSKTAPVE